MSITVLVDRRQRLGPIRDQGSRPTCLSFAGTSAHEHARGSTMALSPEYLNHFVSVGNPTDGASFLELALALRDPGQPSEAECPYYPDGLPLGWQPPAGALLYRRKSVLKDATADEVETLLNAGQTPILGISIPDDFLSPAPPWLISHDGPIRGFHAVVAVGLGTADASRCFLVRNSWGIEWGDNGHAWLNDSFMARHLRDLLALTEEVT